MGFFFFFGFHYVWFGFHWFKWFPSDLTWRFCQPSYCFFGVSAAVLTIDLLKVLLVIAFQFFSGSFKLNCKLLWINPVWVLSDWAKLIDSEIWWLTLKCSCLLSPKILFLFYDLSFFILNCTYNHLKFVIYTYIFPVYYISFFSVHYFG